ncbi:low temperature requirement protein A [Pseudomaricurvus alkylphenolicus]|jgi:low temperature requirement protein LtrA|uniref:low temperature requirement protein A n=1 Tax=Pseudomaricurvus alkylphenolicus TaxID=1306991 RepID=UPI00142269E9|nr:low temperature requirement protein A [Pseudomaricurvus alkylphenolicus]NIB40637.1 low temperature requirement protein A [Pseudomaricurvus alkylphenolicus]
MISQLYKHDSRHATWLELFFDLVFVAVIGVVTHDLAHTHDGHIGTEQLLRFPLVFIPVWWIWMTHTLFSNRFDSDSRYDRMITLAVMGLMVVFSTFAESSMGEGFVQFASLYAGVRLILAAQYFYVHHHFRDEVNFAKDMGAIIGAGALVSLLSVAFDGTLRYLVFYGGIGLDIFLQAILQKKTLTRPVDRKHLVERIGLLAIIILGESVIAMVAALSEVEWTKTAILSSVFGFALLGSIWWIYFDSFETMERSQRLDAPNLLVFSHLFLCMGLLILANLIRHSILGDLDRPTFGLLAIVGLVFFYLGKQIPYWYAFPPWRKAIVGNTVICVSITIASSFMPAIEYSLVGMTLGMMVYVALTHLRVLSVDVDDYLDAHA